MMDVLPAGRVVCHHRRVTRFTLIIV